MFDSSIPFTYCHYSKNRTKSHLHLEEHVYKFFLKTNKSKTKFIVNIKTYPNELLIINYYPKVNSKNKFRILLNLFKQGQIGGTLFNIISDVVTKTGINTFSVQGAENINESPSKEGTKRFKVYKNAFSRKIDMTKYQIFEDSENSIIFVIPINRFNQRHQIILDYGKIYQNS